MYENKVPEVIERIEQVSQIINQTLQDLRSLSKTLTDDNINQKEIVTLIQEEVDNTNAFKKCHVDFKHNFQQLDLGFVHKNVLLRTTQEFIQNSMKHANCKNIFINLNTSEKVLWELNIKDDGIGFDPSDVKSNGIGLTNMKNRAEIIGADFRLESGKNLGTTLNIILKKQP
ncbi:sensor histidine kinase [Flavobacterium sp. B17]|uniref:sensor histidine kinase n=1 Tax=Flavobacterium sp. B17 TaxID=95618 RepID=UPI00034A44FA|nr:ATP-binding protein [Flavobacterium sp. B17]